MNFILVVAGCTATWLEPVEEPGAAAEARRVCAGGETVEGIDVSTWQGTVDWDAVATSVDFAIARVSDGATHPDDRFDENWRGMKDAGLIRGAYQFFRPGQSATAQADLMIDAIGALGPGDLPPVLDVETADGQTGAAVVAGIATWVDRVEAATGRKPILYAGSYFWSTLPDTARFADHPLWIANYGVSCPDVPSPWDGWTMWQYTDRGSVPGIAGHVDRNVFDGTLAELGALADAGPGLAIEVYWARQADGSYHLRALAPSDVVRVEYRVDGWPIGGATLADGHNFPDSYTFDQETSERLFEVLGYDADDALVGHGVGLMDVTAGTAVYIKQMGASLYEIGLERAPAEVAGIEVEVDGRWLLTDSVTGSTRSERNAVRSTFSQLGARDFAIHTFDADGSKRGTLYRTFTLQ